MGCPSVACEHYDHEQRLDCEGGNLAERESAATELPHHAERCDTDGGIVVTDSGGVGDVYVRALQRCWLYECDLQSLYGGCVFGYVQVHHPRQQLHLPWHPAAPARVATRV